jgi:hypothetical protein
MRVAISLLLIFKESMQVNLPSTPVCGGTNLGKEEKEDDIAQINNLIELGFF